MIITFSYNILTIIRQTQEIIALKNALNGPKTQKTWFLKIPDLEYKYVATGRMMAKIYEKMIF